MLGIVSTLFSSKYVIHNTENCLRNHAQYKVVIVINDYFIQYKSMLLSSHNGVDVLFSPHNCFIFHKFISGTIIVYGIGVNVKQLNIERVSNS